MTPAQALRQKRRIERIWNKWRPLLGIDSWDTTVTYHDGVFIEAGGSASGEAIASTVVQWQYQRATVAFNVQNTVDLDDDRLDTVVVHEMMHILVNEATRPELPLGWERSKSDLMNEERLCTLLSWAFLRTLSTA